MVRQSQEQERNGREEGRQQFPFEGLHVYQRAQEAWSTCLAAADQDPLGAEIEREVRRATIGIARARTKIGIVNLAYNLTRFVWHQGRTAPA